MYNLFEFFIFSKSNNMTTDRREVLEHFHESIQTKEIQTKEIQ